jgi:saccharopine dehydrogenase (NAD+, L-lysine-forming)
MDFNGISDATDAMFEGFLEDICSMEMRVYGGDPPAWKTCSWLTHPVSFDFGPPFGTKQCIPVYLEELNEVITTTPTIQEMGFYMAGFHWFTDMVVLPLCMLSLGLLGKRALPSMSKLFASCLRRFSKPPYGSTISLLTKHAPKSCSEQHPSSTTAEHMTVSSSSFQLRRTTVSHVDVYELTAIPAVACVLQMLDDQRPAGLFHQATFVEPVRFFDDMRRMGVTITVEDDDPTIVRHQ